MHGRFELCDTTVVCTCEESDGRGASNCANENGNSSSVGLSAGRSAGKGSGSGDENEVDPVESLFESRSYCSEGLGTGSNLVLDQGVSGCTETS